MRSLFTLVALLAIGDAYRLRKHHRQVPGANDLKAVSAELADAKATLANAKKLDAFAQMEKKANNVTEAKSLEAEAKQEISEASKEMDQASARTNKARADVKKANASKAANVTKNSSKPLSPEDQISHLQAGLNVIQKLKSVFASAQQDSASKFANGAMSEEMGDSNSAIWGAIDTMMNQAQKVQSEMKGKSKAEKEKLMDSLETELNSKARVLSGVTKTVEKKQQSRDEEYLLGVLMSHKDWNMTQQLNATHTFMADSPLIEKLYKHHDDKQPLASQLAALMDAPKSSTAAKMFLQLTDSLHRMRA